MIHKQYCISLKSQFYLANSADRDEISHFVALHQVFTVWKSRCIGVSSLQRINKVIHTYKAKKKLFLKTSQYF